MKEVLTTGWKKCGHFRVRTTIRADNPSVIRREWFRRIVISSSRDHSPESPPNKS